MNVLVSRDVQRRHLAALAIVTATIVVAAYAAVSRSDDRSAADPLAASTTVIPPSPSPRVAVLSGLAADAPAPSAAAVRGLLGSAVATAAVGGRLTGEVVDVGSGTTLWSQSANQLAVPASVTKLLTAAAALRALGGAHRFLTSTRRAGKVIYLVGGGDPTLLRNPASPVVPAYPRPASLAALARATAAASPKGGRYTLRYDATAWSGPAMALGWSHKYVPEGDITPPSALELDEGRLQPGDFDSPRSPTPAAAAATVFAALLRHDGLQVRRTITGGRTPPAATAVAQVVSPPLAMLVQRMLTISDNDLAEALGRAVAIHDGLPATFAGAAEAVTRNVRVLGVAPAMVSLQDASGLSYRDRIAPAALLAVLRAAASPHNPQLRPIVEGLPVAGMTGTLATRFRLRRSRGAAGVARAKTGTLTGVNTLAGLLVDSSGRLLAFAFLASHTTDPERTENAIDSVVARLATCGCTAGP